MALQWGLFVVDTVEFTFPIKHNVKDRDTQLIVKSSEFEWNVSLHLFPHPAFHPANCYLHISPDALDSGYGYDRIDHCHVIVEVSGPNTTKPLCSTHDFQSPIDVFLASAQSFKQIFGDSVAVSLKVVSKSDSESLRFNQQIRMFEQGKKCGDMTLRVHVKRGNERDKDTVKDHHHLIQHKQFQEDKEDQKETSEGSDSSSSSSSSLSAPSSSGIVSLDEDPEISIEHDSSLQTCTMTNSMNSKPVHEFKTSSLMLRSASPYFTSMLDTNMKEVKEMTMDIHASSVQDVEGMVFYLFTNRLMRCMERSDQSLSLIRLAHLYECKGLFDICTQRIMDNLGIDNYVESIKVFDRYEITEGTEKFIQFGTDHFGSLKQHKRYHELPFMFRSVLENIHKNGNDHDAMMSPNGDDGDDDDSKEYEKEYEDWYGHRQNNVMGDDWNNEIQYRFDDHLYGQHSQQNADQE